MSKKRNLLNQKFGRLTIIDYADPIIYNTETNKKYCAWLCKCNTVNEFAEWAVKINKWATKFINNK